MIVLVAPYAWRDVSWAALRLADLALGLGLDVTLAAPAAAPIVRGVDHFWDGRVRSLRRLRPDAAAPPWLARATAVVHFGHDDAARALTGALAAGARQLLVPQASDLAATPPPRFGRYAVLACSTRAACHAAAYLDYDRPPGQQLSWCGVDAGLAPAGREGLVADGRRRGLLWCEAAAPADLLDAARGLLAGEQRLDLTLALGRSWPRRLRRAARAVPRLTLTRLGCRLGNALLCHRHDWVVPLGAASCGHAAALALACGARVVAPSEAPWDELLGGRCHGRLAHGHGLAALADACRQEFADPGPLLRAQGQDWGLAARARDYAAYWAGLLNG